MAGRDLLNLDAPSNETNKREPIDFLAEEPEESLGTAALYAIPRIATDLAKSGYNFATQTLPDWYQAAKTEVPGFLNPWEIAKHPLHRAGQVLAGSLEQGQNINRLPKNIAEYTANRLHLIPPEWAAKVPVAPDIAPAIQNTFGEPLYPGEKLARGVGRNFLNLMGLTSTFNRLPHLTAKGASKKLREAQARGIERQMGPLEINPDLIEDTRNYLGNDSAIRDLIEDAHYGDYGRLFDLQSLVGKESAPLSKSWFSPAERNKGRAGLNLQKSIVNAMRDSIESQGNLDISELLRQGRNDYRRYMKFKPYRNILGGALGAYALGKAMPRNALTNLGEKIVSQFYK